MAFSHDGLSVVSGGNDRTAWVRRADGQGDPVALRGNGGPIWGVAFSPDDRRVATADDDGTVGVRSVDGGGRVLLTGHTGPVESVAFSPDGRLVASAGDDGTVRIWRAGGDRRPTVLTGHAGIVWGVVFTPDGVDTPGLVRGSSFLLRNTNTTGAADLNVHFEPY